MSYHDNSIMNYTHRNVGNKNKSNNKSVIFTSYLSICQKKKKNQRVH